MQAGLKKLHHVILGAESQMIGTSHQNNLCCSKLPKPPPSLEKKQSQWRWRTRSDDGVNSRAYSNGGNIIDAHFSPRHCLSNLQVGNFIPSMETTIKSGGESLIKFTKFFNCTDPNILTAYIWIKCKVLNPAMKFQIWTIDGNSVRALSSNSRNRRFYSTGVQTFFSIPLMAIGIEMEITFHIGPYAKLSLFSFQVFSLKYDQSWTLPNITNKSYPLRKKCTFYVNWT